MIALLALQLAVTLLVVALLCAGLVLSSLRWETRLDAVLTWIFAPLHYVGIVKCDRCSVRARRAQIALVLTTPLRRVARVGRWRARWAEQVPSRHRLVEPFEGLMFTDARVGRKP